MGHYRSEIMEDSEEPCGETYPHARHDTYVGVYRSIACPGVGVPADSALPPETVEPAVDETDVKTDAPAEAKDEIATSLMEMLGNYVPIFDTADGMRADLERRGWSPTAAEQVALTWLTGAIARSWTG